MNDIILLTDAAVEAAKERLEKRGTPHACIRVGVKGSGCSGFTYVIEFWDDAPREKDVEYFCNGIKILVDNRSLAYLKGTVIDYKKTLLSSGFAFNNPNAAKTCGCGESFEIRKE